VLCPCSVAGGEKGPSASAEPSSLVRSAFAPVALDPLALPCRQLGVSPGDADGLALSPPLSWEKPCSCGSGHTGFGPGSGGLSSVTSSCLTLCSSGTPARCGVATSGRCGSRGTIAMHGAAKGAGIDDLDLALVWIEQLADSLDGFTCAPGICKLGRILRRRAPQIAAWNC